MDVETLWLRKMDRLIRNCFIIAAIVVVATFANATAAAPLTADATSRLDGICKADPLSSGFVAVKEFRSEKCASQATMNAWYVDRAKDGLVVCEAPSYDDAFASAAIYASARRVFTIDCPFVLDGSPNAFVLEAPGSRPVDDKCINTAIQLSAYASGLIEWTTPLYWPVATTIDKDCPSVAALNWNKLRAIPIFVDASVVDEPLCLAGNEWLAARMQRTALIDPGDLDTNRYYVIRRFYSELCPSSQPGRNVNAIVVRRFQVGGYQEEMRGVKLTACVVTLPSVIGTKWNILIKRFNDERCGSDQGDNTFSITFPGQRTGRIGKYVVKGGEVYDPILNITWSRCALGRVWDEFLGCTGAAHLYGDQNDNSGKWVNLKFDVAVPAPWRLPTFAELGSLLTSSINESLFTDTVAFPDAPNSDSTYLSSSQTNESNGTYFCRLSIRQAVAKCDSTSTYGSYAVRLVRTGR